MVSSEQGRQRLRERPIEFITYATTDAPFHRDSGAYYAACSGGVTCYPFTAPAVNPDIRDFCPIMNSRIDGTKIMIVPAMIGP